MDISFYFVVFITFAKRIMVRRGLSEFNPELSDERQSYVSLNKYKLRNRKKLFNPQFND